jgi:hypothetical protein
MAPTMPSAGGTPEAMAMPMDSGMAMRKTTMEAIRSAEKLLRTGPT